jgi:hypothetical protein
LAGRSLRQLLVQDLGHEEPTILLTNQRHAPAKALLTRYAQRMLIENALSDAGRFFHIDALSSAVGLKVDFDMALLVLASGLYRLLAQRMRGYAVTMGPVTSSSAVNSSATNPACNSCSAACSPCSHLTAPLCDSRRRPRTRLPTVSRRKGPGSSLVHFLCMIFRIMLSASTRTSFLFASIQSCSLAFVLFELPNNEPRSSRASPTVSSRIQRTDIPACATIWASMKVNRSDWSIQTSV